jgi:hypothetical protein
LTPDVREKLFDAARAQALPILCRLFFSYLNMIPQVFGRSLRMVSRDPVRDDEGYIRRRRSPGPRDGTP